MDFVFFVIPGLCVAALIGYFIGAFRGDPASGAILGFLLGPLGWLLALMITDKRPKCRLCQGILPSVTVIRCKHCGGDQLPQRPGGGMALDPMEAWEREQALKPENMKPLVKKAPALRPPPSRDRRK